MTLFLIKPRKWNSETPIKYLFRDGKCLGCTCFSPGKRGMKPHYLMNYPRYTPHKEPVTFRVCVERIDNGCPKDTGYTKERYLKRLREGWKTSPI